MTKIQGLVFFGIIAGGTTLSIVSLNKWGKRVEVEEEPPPAVSTTDEPKPGDQSMTPADTPPEPKPPAGAPRPPEPAPPGAANPQVLAQNLARMLEKGDVDAILEMASDDAVSPQIKKQLENLIQAKGLKIDPEKPVTELAKSPGGARWVIHMKNPTTGEKVEIYADVAKAEGGQGWEIKKLTVPAVMAGGDGMQQSAGASGDALSVAYEFAKAVMERDFERARKLTSPDKITDERIAALMIAIEEGKFHLRGDKPLVVTLARDDLSWILARVDSADGSSEFAIEMNPDGENGWEIHGLTFSKVIATIANAAGAGNVAYTPIVADPQGGDSLVLYFEFDEAGLSDRSRKQLAIVADILRQDAKRRIHINGHADALGTDEYNKSLSDERAASVGTALLGMGIGQDQVVTEAFGEAMPRRPNFNPDGTDNPAGRSQNRRAEVYLDF